MAIRIKLPEDRIAEFCRRHHIRRLALFDLVLREAEVLCEPAW